MITVITVVFNGEDYLEETILSVIGQTYTEIEYIVIDGGSTDGTIDIIKKYEAYISCWISEKDNGIYDAMNKGLGLAKGIWVNFMNAGDTFYNESVITDFFNVSSKLKNIDFFYSDSMTDKNTIYFCDKEKRRLIHQALIYKTNVHNNVGKYISVKNLTTADYFFFMLASDYCWYKLDFLISKHDTTGISSGLHTFLQKNAIDLLFGYESRLKTIVFLMIHPTYNLCKKTLIRLRIIK